ncbi:MAG: hypothetical protein Q7T16_02385 [Candidatus Burarchaeum sp.]|nr:hypothetical protein [Candidatus Burarchaeum sp.]MDO8339482.1 hypothetical protein [Candidatus Burarchaeum sp.]
MAKTGRPSKKEIICASIATAFVTQGIVEGALRTGEWPPINEFLAKYIGEVAVLAVVSAIVWTVWLEIR